MCPIFCGDLNYRVFAASSAQAALTILIQDAPKVDLLLTDVVMPGINGRELGRRAQQSRPGIKILYMTGYFRNAVVHQGRLDEGVELLETPHSDDHGNRLFHRCTYSSYGTHLRHIGTTTTGTGAGAGSRTKIVRD
jgi:CheY-like chemotaxis protein